MDIWSHRGIWWFPCWNEMNRSIHVTIDIFFVVFLAFFYRQSDHNLFLCQFLNAIDTLKAFHLITIYVLRIKFNAMTICITSTFHFVWNVIVAFLLFYEQKSSLPNLKLFHSPFSYEQKNENKKIEREETVDIKSPYSHWQRWLSTRLGHVFSCHTIPMRQIKEIIVWHFFFSFNDKIVENYIVTV